MNKDTPLSEKIYECEVRKGEWLDAKDVKDVVKKLKEATEHGCNCKDCLHELIKDFFGEELSK